MTSHKVNSTVNSEFCFLETLNAEGNIEVEGKQNSLFPERPVIKCFAIPPDSKMEQTEKYDLLDAIAYAGCAPKIERLPKPTCVIEKSR